MAELTTDDKPGLGTLAFVLAIAIPSCIYQAWLTSIAVGWYVHGFTMAHAMALGAAYIMMHRPASESSRKWHGIVVLALYSPLKTSMFFGCVWLIRGAYFAWWR